MVRMRADLVPATTAAASASEISLQPFIDPMEFMQRIQNQYHTALEQMYSGMQANAELWADSHGNFSKLWLESVENLSLALLPMDTMPKFDALMGFDLKVKDLRLPQSNCRSLPRNFKCCF